MPKARSWWSMTRSTSSTSWTSVSTGYEVITALDGEQALSVKADKPDRRARHHDASSTATRSARRSSRTPRRARRDLLSAKGRNVDQKMGFDVGADDTSRSPSAWARRASPAPRPGHLRAPGLLRVQGRPPHRSLHPGATMRPRCHPWPSRSPSTIRSSMNSQEQEARARAAVLVRLAGAASGPVSEELVQPRIIHHRGHPEPGLTLTPELIDSAGGWPSTTRPLGEVLHAAAPSPRSTARHRGVARRWARMARVAAGDRS
jgi:hypothetical protein